MSTVISSPHRARVNGASLNVYHGKPVCVMGTVTRAEGGGMSFQMRSSDGQQINVRLKKPIDQPLEGLVEVYGIGQGRNLVLADSFINFNEHFSAGFDMASHNDMINLFQQIPGCAWLPKTD